MSPVRAQSQQLLESPRRKLRSVCKTPYRVLDAPELADDFYLNLVDCSSTNVLGVSLGSCVYLWTAHGVSKLCDLSPSNDTISSVSRKGPHLSLEHFLGGFTFTMLQHHLCSDISTSSYTTDRRTSLELACVIFGFER